MAKCGAKTKTGKPCKNSGMPNGRCRFHGGKTPKGQKNALKFGIYSQGIKESEEDLWHQIEVGTLDDEIKIMKIQLARAVKAQRELEEEIEEAGSDKGKTGFELSEIKASNFGGIKRKEVVKKRPDFRKIIYTLSGRIGKLEATRDQMKKGHPGGNDDTPTPVKVEIMVEDGRVTKDKN